LGPNIKPSEIEVPPTAAKQKPGQFVIVCLHEHGELIPLTIEGSNPEKAAWTCFVGPPLLGATGEPPAAAIGEVSSELCGLQLFKKVSSDIDCASYGGR
jgi:hypothetical protein